MSPKKIQPAKELEYLLKQARQGDASPLCAKVFDWTGGLLQIVLLVDTDAGNGPWLRGKLGGKVAELCAWYRAPVVDIVASKEAMVDLLQLNAIQGNPVFINAAHHITLTRSEGGQIANVKYFKGESEG